MSKARRPKPTASESRARNPARSYQGISRQFLAYRPGAPPIFDSKDLREWQKSTAFEVEEGEVRGTFLSKNADLAWTWGTYKGEFSAQPTTGYWAQI